MQQKNSNMELPYHHKHQNFILHGDSGMLVLIRHYESKVLKILAQALILALLIMLLPGIIGARFRDDDSIRSHNLNLINHEVVLNMKSLPSVLHDLSKEGLLTTRDKSLIISKTKRIMGTFQDDASLIVLPWDTKDHGSVSDETFDFSFSNCFDELVGGFVDRTLKLGGILAIQLSRDPSMAFQVPSNYKIVYFRRLDDATYIAMRKTTYAKATLQYSSAKRKLLEFLSEEKKAVLGNLEDVLLEPPRSATGKSKAYLRKTKFLPDLLNDSLDGYSRRVYIDVGGGHGSTRWFKQNYPTRNKDFDIYRIETVPEEDVESDDAWEGPPTQIGISDWLWRNVKAEEYVVMKADAEVVEEMLRSKAIVLVDELFLECKPFGKGGTSKRAYWECLALYGRLRDFGVAVHQWWG